MHDLRRFFLRAVMVALALLMPRSIFADGEEFEQRGPANRPPAERMVDVLIATTKPYDDVVAQIQATGGRVRLEYENIDAIAATIPTLELDALEALPEILAIEKDRRIVRDDIRGALEHDELGAAGYVLDIDPEDLSGHTAVFSDAAPNGYFPVEVNDMRASDFWNATGHFGENVIIGIMDSGTANVSAISGRVIGGESFLFATPSIDDGLPPNSPSNGSHGTWVATTAGANVIFGFFSTSGLVQGLKAYLPDSVLPDYFGPGIDGVPVVGPAPFSEFFALKVFNTNGVTTNSVLLAAFDRAIELKQLYDNGDPAGVDLRVLNGSFSGGSLYAGDDPFFAGMIAAVNAAGIVTVFSASNDGPGLMTIGDPGSARNTLTVGATSRAEYEQVLRDLQGGPGFGALWRANNAHQIAEFSSRGPTSDGRMDPDLVAPGATIFAQGASGGLSFVSGTSFSAPNVAGCAALLLSADPSMTPDEVRGALLNGANPNLLDDNPGPEEQGFGFVDVLAAASASTANPSDMGAELSSVAANVEALGYVINGEDHFSHTTDWLTPGEEEHVFVEIAQPHTALSVAISVEQENDPGSQNQLFGDQALISATNSWTHFGAYYTVQLVATATSFTISESGLDYGLVRISLAGDDDNAGRVRLTLTVDKEKGQPPASQNRIAKGKVGQSEVDVHAFEVPAGLTDLTLYLSWGNTWASWPTNDLDLILIDPNGNPNFAGATLSAPERVALSNPTAGTWTALVAGFTVWPNDGGDFTEPYQFASSVKLMPKASTEPLADRLTTTPAAFDVSQNAPNPFNPSTTIEYALPEGADVKVDIFDVRGARVAQLVNEHQPAGFHRITWHGRDDAGARVPSGVYFYKVRAGDRALQKRMLLLK